jgi:tRNA(His) guanylyltransferase
MTFKKELTMKTDDLGDRMKAYEAHECDRRFIAGLPIYARIDGRGFSKFTRGMARPYDIRLTNAMIDVTKTLVRETHATVGYVQSDEISLLWRDSDLFDRKSHKLHSVLASLAAVAFANGVIEYFDDWKSHLAKMPHFDARVIALPSEVESANMMMWRNLDATKNAISMAAHAHFSHRELQNVKSAEKQEMLFHKGINFNDFPYFFKRGTWVRTVTKEKFLTPEELTCIPEKHRPTGMVTRGETVAYDLPPLNRISNPVAVLFENAEPIPRE